MKEKKKIIHTLWFKMLISAFIIIGIAGFSVRYYIKEETITKPDHELVKDCKIEEKTFEGRNVFMITPQQTKEDSTIILYVHGGSYLTGISKQHWRFFNDLIADTGCTIIVPDYPLLPDHQYQDSFTMMEKLYQEMVKQIPKERFVLMGDSAGGGMALGLLEKISQDEIRQPEKTILISPWLDVTLENPEIPEVEKVDPLLHKLPLQIAGKLYAGKEGIHSYLVNPVNGPLEKLENVILYSGTYDIFNPDAKLLVNRAKEAGTEIDFRQTTGATHIWLIYRHEKDVYQAEEGYQDLVQTIKEI